MRVSHVVYGENEASGVVVDGLANLVDEALLELEADLLARLGESDGTVAAGLRHLGKDERILWTNRTRFSSRLIIFVCQHVQSALVQTT